MTHSPVQITRVNTQAKEGINIQHQFYHCCDWSWHPVRGWEHLKDLQSFPIGATFICIWPFYWHLVSMNIQPEEYEGLTAWGIVTFGLTPTNLFAAGSEEPLSVTCDTLWHNTVHDQRLLMHEIAPCYSSEGTTNSHKMAQSLINCLTEDGSELVLIMFSQPPPTA